jgi:hypothetical protein
VESNNWRTDEPFLSVEGRTPGTEGNLELRGELVVSWSRYKEDIMGFGKGALLWLIGIPLPIILLLAIFMHH